MKFEFPTLSEYPNLPDNPNFINIKAYYFDVIFGLLKNTDNINIYNESFKHDLTSILNRFSISCFGNTVIERKIEYLANKISKIKISKNNFNKINKINFFYNKNLKNLIVEFYKIIKILKLEFKNNEEIYGKINAFEKEINSFFSANRGIFDIKEEINTNVLDKSINIENNIENSFLIKQKLSTIFTNIFSNINEHAFLENFGGEKKVIINGSFNDNLDYIIQVSDNGVGIKEVEINNIFKEGETSKLDKEGHGIGMYSAKKYLESFGGKIEVQSDGVGEGTTFIITIPKGIIINNLYKK